MGARYIDYMLTDRIAAPPEYRRYMREKQVRPQPPQPASP
jgi:predicted O-linked N-acetylglucosamine transferase (SPINDLY family)